MSKVSIKDEENVLFNNKRGYKDLKKKKSQGDRQK